MSSRVSPEQETSTHLHAALRRYRKIEAAREGLSHLESLPDEPCGVTWDGNDYCTRPAGHRGSHNVTSPQVLEDLW